MKKKKNNLPGWMKSKYFLLGSSLLLAVIVVLGIKTFAWTGPAPECVKYKLSGRLFSCQAYHYIGTKESPAMKNRGAAVDVFNRFGGCPLGSPWCASFLGYSFYQATGSSILNTCYTGDFKPRFAKYGKSAIPFTSGKILHSGDYLYKQRAPYEGQGHVGVVYSVLDNGDFTTIEGNTRCSSEYNDCVRFRKYYANGAPRESDNPNNSKWEYALRWYPNEYPVSPQITN